MRLIVTGCRSRGGSLLRTLAFWAILFCLGATSSPARADFTLGRLEADGIELLWSRPASFGTETVANLEEAEVGWIALPPGAEFVLEAVQVDDRAVSPPVSSETQDPSLFVESDFLEAIELGEPTWVRDQYGIPVTVRGDYLATNGGWRRTYGLRIEGHWSDATQLSRQSTGRDPFERVYAGQFLNYEQGRAWRRAVSARARARGTDSFASTNQPWIRIRVREEAVHAITGSALEDLGIDLGDVDPSTLRLFSPLQLPLSETASVDDVPAWMDELPLGVEGLGDDVFDSGDRVWFLGHGSDDWYTNKGVTRPGEEAFARDPYSNDSVYWLTWGGSFSGQPVRMEVVDASDVATPFVSVVRDRIHLEEEEISDSRQRDIVSSPAPYWEQFWWREHSAGEVSSASQNVTVQVPDAVESDPVRVEARFWGANDPRSPLRPPPPDHDHELFLNDQSVARHEWNGITRQEYDNEGTWLVPGETQVFRVFTQSHSDGDPELSRFDIAYLAYIELTYSRRLALREGRLAFYPGGLIGAQSFEVAGLGSDDVIVLDATDPRRPTVRQGAVVDDGGERKLRFTATVSSGFTTSRLVVSERDAFVTPIIELDRPPQGGYLRDSEDAVQMIIITAEEFLAEAERLADHRRSVYPDRSTASVRVVDVQDIFDEFSFGRKDPTAIRNFLQLARDGWTGGNPDDGPANVCFLGDAHRDHRGTLEGVGIDFVPTYTRYFDSRFVPSVYDPRFSSDDYFALLGTSPDHGMDLFVGRLAAQNAAQAATMVDKIIHYELNSAMGDWRNRVTLIADDLCQGTSPDGLGTTHTSQTETLSDNFFPETLERSKIYMVEYGRECVFSNKPDVTAALLRDVNDGTLVVNFTGHGGEDQVADERILEVSGVGNIDNLDNMFLFLTASCSIGKYDSSSESLAEALMRHTNGGAIIVFSASAVATSNGNAAVNRAFFGNMFPGGQTFLRRPVGESAVNAKLSLNSTSLNQRRFVVHGDPALRLLSPELDIELSLSDASTGAQLADSIGRGQRVELRGEVLDADGTVQTNFDGDVLLNVLDSELLRTIVRLDYNLPGAEVYRARVPVENGIFSTEFQMPSALRTGPRGNAAVYAYAASGRLDAGGGRISFAIPETVPPPSTDQAGPVLALDFAEGVGAVTPGGLFSATLSDSSGINVSGLVSSRSVIFRIEDEEEILFAEDLSARVTFGSDFRNGRFESEIPRNLPVGRRYRAVLEASDNLNNRSTVETTFSVVGENGGGLSIRDLYNFPNPTEDVSRFFASINREADVDVELFTLRGKRIVRITRSALTPSELESVGIEWDGYDEDGDRPGNGVYFYRLTAKPLDGSKNVSAIGRLVVSR